MNALEILFFVVTWFLVAGATALILGRIIALRDRNN